MVIELKPEEFNDRLLPIFREVEQEAGALAVPFNSDYFFSQWRKLMGLGIARTWEHPDGAVLGAVFAPNTFSGNAQGLVSFWFAKRSARKTGATGSVFRAFETAAKQSGCSTIYSAAFKSCDYLARCDSYVKHGFEKTESLFRKVLK